MRLPRQLLARRGGGVRAACVFVLVVAGLVSTEAAAAQSPSAVDGQVSVAAVDLRQAGARCDGRGNDQPALQSAIDAMAARGGGTVWIPAGTCRIVQTGTAVLTQRYGGVTIRGRSAMSQLTLDSDDPTGFRELFSVSGAGSGLVSLRLVRARDLYTVMIDIKQSTGFRLTDVVVDGRQTAAGRQEVHGLRLNADPGTFVRDVALTRVTIQKVGYGLFQDRAVTATTDGFRVVDSTFRMNSLDDLEFNSPQGTMLDVSVTGSTFSQNRATEVSSGAGFGIGLANVQRAEILDNVFDGYAFEPVHIEDRSAYVLLEGNRFRRSFTADLNYASHVFIINASHHITVTGNDFDTSANVANTHLDCVYLGAGGGVGEPSYVTITDNVFRLRPNASAVGDYGSSHVTVSGNTIIPLS